MQQQRVLSTPWQRLGQSSRALVQRCLDGWQHWAVVRPALLILCGWHGGGGLQAETVLPTTTPLLIAHVDFVGASVAQPPADTAAWQSQSLPDQWRRNHPGQTTDGWYRARFTLTDIPADTRAIYLPRLCMNAAIYLNGVLIGQGGQFSEPLARYWNRPMLLTLPAGLLRVGTNTVHIRVRAPVMVQGSLSAFEIGPEQQLKPRYDSEFFARITVNQALTLIIGMVGILMLSLWWRRRRDVMYGYFGASALIWALNSTNLHIQSAPLPTRHWEILVNASFQWFVPLLLVSLLRFLWQRRPWLERGLWSIAVLAPTSLLLTPDASLVSGFVFWNSATLVAAVIAAVVLIPAAFRQRSVESRLLLLGLMVNLGFGIHDWLVHSKLLPPLMGADTRIHLLHFGAPVFFLVVGWIMTSRFVGALNQLENMNVELEQRVQAKTVELQDNFRQLQRLQNEQAVLAERERIYRDLHDDIGAKLLQLVYRSDNHNAELARSALQDLRDVVSHPGGPTLNLNDLLADWRAETDERLTAAQIQLHWHQSERLALDFLQPQAIHLGRILREAISNVIRHAHATQVTITLAQTGAAFVLCISDDGVGLADPSAAGRGRNNMQLRARRVGGEIHWLRGEPQGCTVQLTVPIPAQREQLMVES